MYTLFVCIRICTFFRMICSMIDLLLSTLLLDVLDADPASRLFLYMIGGPYMCTFDCYLQYWSTYPCPCGHRINIVNLIIFWRLKLLPSTTACQNLLASFCNYHAFLFNYLQDNFFEICTCPDWNVVLANRTWNWRPVIGEFVNALPKMTNVLCRDTL